CLKLEIIKKTIVLWATSRSRVPIDGAAIASDVRVSNCREQRDDDAIRDA
ncbi:hypothetical protein AVEN_188533-1, partial [Araneus ventricosus]